MTTIRPTPSRVFLMALWEGGGTLPPELGLARRLISAGHIVHVIADPTVADDAAAAGCGFTPWTQAPHRTTLDPEEDLLADWEVRNPLAMLARIRDTFVAGPAGAYAADTATAIDAVAPDGLIADFMLFGAMMAGQAAGLPVAAVIPNIWAVPIPGAPAMGPGFSPARTIIGRARDTALRRLAMRVFGKALPTLNAVRADLSLPPLKQFHDQVLDADRILVLTSETFDFAAPHVPAHVRYTGPILDDPHWAEPWIAPWPDDDPDPLVLVAFSSTFQDQAPLLGRVVAALDELPVRALVTRGQMLSSDAVAGTDRVAVVASAPHREVLPQAAVVVTHCGHGTTMKALAAGVPMVCIPMGRDQNDTAARVVAQGAGVRLPTSASSEAIRRAVQQVLDDASYTVNARRMGDVIAEEIARADPVHELVSMLPLEARPG